MGRAAVEGLVFAMVPARPECRCCSKLANRLFYCQRGIGYEKREQA